MSPLCPYSQEIEGWWMLPLGPYSQDIFFVSYKWAKESRCLHNTWLERVARDKHSNLLGQFASHKEIEVLWIWPLGPYSQDIFFVTYKWAKESRMVHYTRLERLAKNKCSNLLGQYVSYKEIEVLGVGSLFTRIQGVCPKKTFSTEFNVVLQLVGPILSSEKGCNYGLCILGSY